VIYVLRRQVQTPNREGCALWSDAVYSGVQPPVCSVLKDVEAVGGETGQDTLDVSLESLND